MPWLYLVAPLAGLAALIACAALAWRFRAQLGTTAQWKAAADAARDWAAVLYTPILTIYAVWLTCLIVWAYPWDASTERQRLNFVGIALVGALMLIGLGTLFYQRRSATIKGNTAAGGFEVTSSDGQLAAAVEPKTGAVSASTGGAATPAPAPPPPVAKPAAKTPPDADKPPWERKP